MTRTVINDSSSVILDGCGNAVLVYGPGTFDSDTVYVAGVQYTGLIHVVAGHADKLLPLHPYYMAGMPLGLFLAMALAFITTRFRL